jgi:glycosyltransferase involved in cell wall biosynthesis
MQISVIICTHNPEIDRLCRVVSALRDQTLPLIEWELIIVDNASDTLLTEVVDGSWHPNFRVIREDKLGLTPARLTGIEISTNELLIFVDDDNELERNYLSAARDVFLNQPDLGACSGNAVAEFETSPPEWLNNYLPFLGIRHVDSPIFTKAYFDWKAMPIGAGLCVRREIALGYLKRCQVSLTRQSLGRLGQLLISGEDSDLAMTAIDLDFQVGLSPVLTLRHLIPTERCSEEYVVRLMEGITFSGLLLESVRGVGSDVADRSFVNVLRRLASYTRAVLTLKGIDRKVYFAKRRGEAAFRQWSLTNQEI